MNLIQNSALSFSVCIEDKYDNFSKFLEEIKLKYNVTYFKNVSLVTIRHATDEAMNKIAQKGDILLKQVALGTVQFVVNKQ